MLMPAFAIAPSVVSSPLDAADGDGVAVAEVVRKLRLPLLQKVKRRKRPKERRPWRRLQREMKELRKWRLIARKWRLAARNRAPSRGRNHVLVMLYAVVAGVRKGALIGAPILAVRNRHRGGDPTEWDQQPSATFCTRARRFWFRSQRSRSRKRAHE
jgi:hypothetical protein